MDLKLDLSVAQGYHSPAQIARRVTEHWASANLFCPACPSDSLTPSATNTAVVDYQCPECGRRYQLKGKSSPFGRVVSNSAFSKKQDAIESGVVPHYAFLHYSRITWSVRGLFLVPGYFITNSVINERRPLGSEARRAGWVGSNILLGKLPADARVNVVTDGTPREPEQVRKDWSRYRFLEKDAAGGWGGDVLTCINELCPPGAPAEFTLREFYDRFTDRLSRLHPANKNVQPKIRQQLQVLRDGGTLEFLRPGLYRLRKL